MPIQPGTATSRAEAPGARALAEGRAVVPKADSASAGARAAATALRASWVCSAAS